MRWPFRREPRGRHALGAAVTSIPVGPVRPVADAVPFTVAPVTPPAPVVPVQAAPAVPEPVVQPVEELLVAPPAVPVEPVAPPVWSAAPAPLPPLDLMLGDAPPVEAPVVVPAQAVAPPPAPPGPRVELGFADGTFRMLDPTSPAAQALSELVGELTSKDSSGSGPADSRR